MRNRVALVSISVILALVFPVPAHADAIVFADSDDTASRLDIRWVQQGHACRQADCRLRHKIRTFEAWPRRLLDGHEAFVRILFDISGDAEVDRILRVWVDDSGAFVAQLRTLDGRRVAGHNPRVRKTNRYTLLIDIDRAALLGADWYRWQADTVWGDPDGVGPCGMRPDGHVFSCVDRAPQEGPAVHGDCGPLSEIGVCPR